MTDQEFRAVFEQHKDAVYHFAWRMTNSPPAAEDIAQDVFLSLWRGEAKLDPLRGSWRSLLLGMARNAAWKRWRRDQKWAPLEEDILPVVPLPAEEFDVQSAVSQAVQALPPLQRESLILATYGELSLQEIGEATGAEIGTVKARLHRARENLKRLLAAYKPGQVSTRREYGTAR
jgi:RNA polymerase sigma-70 factor (ECF subfamily)